MLDNLNFIAKHFKQRSSELEDKFSSISEPVKGRVTAVDGGAGIILDGGAWLLSKLRTAGITYDGKKISEQKDDYYFTIIKSNDYYSFINKGFKLANDWTGIRDITEAPSLVMKALEFRKGSSITEMKPGLLLMDSLLASESVDQAKWLKELEARAVKQGVDVVGFSKTCRLSINGQSLIGALLRKKPRGRWFYPLKDGSFVVKLHDKARYCYLINLFKHSLKHLSSILSMLAYYSKDAELLGYPYPLLKVDKIARINEYEKKREITKLKILLRKNKLSIEEDERSTDMHSYLDTRFWRK